MSAVFAAGLRRAVDIYLMIGGNDKEEEEERKETGGKLKEQRYCSTCQCHHRIAQIGRIFRRSSSEETCQTCPDDRCSLDELPDVHSAVVQLRMSHSEPHKHTGILLHLRKAHEEAAE